MRSLSILIACKQDRHSLGLVIGTVILISYVGVRISRNGITYGDFAFKTGGAKGKPSRQYKKIGNDIHYATRYGLPMEIFSRTHIIHVERLRGDHTINTGPQLNIERCLFFQTFSNFLSTISLMGHFLVRDGRPVVITKSSSRSRCQSS